MKTKRNLVIATTLLACLAATLVSGCTKKEEGRSDQATPVASQPTAKKEMTLKLLRPEHQAQALKTDTPVLREIANKTGVKLQVESIPSTGYNDKKRALIATNNIPDIIQVEKVDLDEFSKSGIFLAVSDYLDQMPNLQKVITDNPEIKRLYIDGKLYGFPIAVQNNLQYAKALLIRTDILQKLNLAVPTTFDELYAVLKKMKEAYPDSYPFSSRGLGAFLDAFAFGMGGGLGIYYDPDVKGGQYVYGTNKPEFKKVLTYLNKLYQEKLLDPDFAVLNNQTWGEKNNTGKAFFYYDNNSFAINFNQALQKDNPQAKFDVIPYLKNDSGKSRGYLYPRGWLTFNYAISSKVKDPAAVMKFYDWLYSPEGAEISNFGILGETYEKVNGEPRVLDSIIAKYKNAADPVRTMQSELGTGYLALSPLVDERPNTQISDPIVMKWSEQLKKDPGAFVWPGVNPGFTKEESDKLKEIQSKVSPIEQDVVKFIMGAKQLGEFDAFAASLDKAGVADIEKIYNDALARAGK
ncbi:extracellular solute-binding protein [Paenibacillus cymbidii]|uniref:extracellular solute-binding protein n=1 Tax=Paenibacillus cymbidii TaxID=1639034 RepID=UPI0010809397|nr:extracellular solute-binding protein [Paenibacillus cymbidii]